MILPEYKNTALRQLKVINGQLGGVTKLVDEERYCLDILAKIAAIQKALRGVSRQVVQNHLETFVTDSIKKETEKSTTGN
jgi:CsoR family transcriptional regulator, copper-sensing transcriptional repressor